jgi:exosortase
MDRAVRVPTSEFTRSSKVALGLVLGAAAIVYAPVISKLAHDWWTDPEYSHGLLCAPAALAIVFARRRALAAQPPEPRPWGLAGSIAAMGLLALGTLGAELFLTRMSLVLLLASGVIYLLGWRHLRMLAFPFALLVLSIPIPAIIITRVTLPLQLAASAMSEQALAVVNVPVLRDGNVLMLPNATLQVAEACSGVRSLVALVVLALVIARYVDRRPGVRAAIVAAAAPVAVLVNGLRVTLTATATYHFGTAAAAGAIHETMGVATFLVAVALLAGCARALHAAASTRVAGAAG